MQSVSQDGPEMGMPGPRAGGAWRELEVLVLALLVAVLYFSRLTDLTIRGEESRWARVAHEMISSGDWIVPRQQGAPFPDRPPLNSWAMILASTFTGQFDLAAIRLPAVTSTLLTTLLIYLYGRNYLSRLGAFAAAASYATMAQILMLGRLAESDSLLTLCLCGALFGWHYAYARRASPALAWTLGYGLAAVAGLAKGPQGPVYFVAITTALLAVRGDWRFLFNRWHAVGLFVFALVVGAWQVPFYLALDANSACAIWSEGGDVAKRFVYHGVGRALARWFSYPFEVWGSSLPWSFMLPLVATRWFRQSIGNARPMVMFLAVAFAVTFPTCWLPADSRPRHFMSMYPCLALLCGLTIQRSWESRQLGWWQRSWDNYLLTGVALILGAPAALVVCRLLGAARWRELAQEVSALWLAVYVLAAVSATAAVFWSRKRHDLSHARAGVLAVAVFMGLSYTIVVMTFQMRTANDPSAEVARIREMLPPGERLISLGKVHHLFAYYYGQPIEMRKLPRRQVAPNVEDRYFCFAEDPGTEPLQIPFDWEPIAEVSCERARSDQPRTKVVIGRRLDYPHRQVGLWEQDDAGRRSFETSSAPHRESPRRR
jgi:4-amino-4-deoxy-L-arabinose transferase-like glycosyltransferase